MQVGGEGSEFQIPDSELEGSVNLRVPAPQEAAIEVEVLQKEVNSLLPDRLPPNKLPSDSLPSEKVIFSRGLLYVQAVVFPLTVLLAFALGYMAGRGRAAGSIGPAQVAAESRVPVEGKVTGDDSALILILPAAFDKPAPLSAAAFQVALMSGPSAEFQRMIEQIGGSCTRSKPSGTFFLYVPTRGSYRVLIVAHSAVRPGGTPIDAGDRLQMSRYFDDPTAAVSTRNYRWMTRELSVEGAKPIEVWFGG